MTSRRRWERLPPRLQSFALTISALQVATPAEVRYAFTQAVRAYAQSPSAANALKVEATVLALSRMWRDKDEPSRALSTGRKALLQVPASGQTHRRVLVH